jgi:hypothetical protein
MRKWVMSLYGPGWVRHLRFCLPRRSTQTAHELPWASGPAPAGGRGKLATGGGSVDVEGLRQSTSPAEGAHNLQAVAFPYGRFHKRNTTSHQGIGRHFDIGP